MQDSQLDRKEDRLATQEPEGIRDPARLERLKKIISPTPLTAWQAKLTVASIEKEEEEEEEEEEEFDEKEPPNKRLKSNEEQKRQSDEENVFNSNWWKKDSGEPWTTNHLSVGSMVAKYFEVSNYYRIYKGNFKKYLYISENS